jgi:hypothetical protein
MLMGFDDAMEADKSRSSAGFANDQGSVITEPMTATPWTRSIDIERLVPSALHPLRRYHA